MKLLVSACLLGVSCRYDGGGGYNEEVAALINEHELIPVCPEQLGGMKTPREPAERQGDRVVNRAGEDVTEYYERGAREVLKLAKLYGCECAILKERSPSCGCGRIYDGTFTGRLTDGDGMAAQALKAHGVQVMGESGIVQKWKGKDPLL